MNEYKNMVSLRIYPEKTRKKLVMNYVCDVLSQYIRYICWSRKVYLIRTRQPLKNPEEFFESGVDKDNVNLLYKAARNCIKNPTEQTLVVLSNAAEYFYPPYGNLKKTWKKEIKH